MADDESQGQHPAEGLASSASDRQLLLRVFGQSALSLGLSDTEREHTLSPANSLILSGWATNRSFDPLRPKYVSRMRKLPLPRLIITPRKRVHLPRIGPFEYGSRDLLDEEDLSPGLEVYALGSDPFAKSSALISELLEILEKQVILSPKPDIRPHIFSPSSSSNYYSISSATEYSGRRSNLTPDTSILSPFSPSAHALRRNFSQSYEDLIEGYPLDVSCTSSSYYEESSFGSYENIAVTRHDLHQSCSLTPFSTQHSDPITTRTAHTGAALIQSSGTITSFQTRRRLRKGFSRKLKLHIPRFLKGRGETFQ
ncbi:uncharacterized protein N7459_004160 [Penicillium hispanicum]|uniref:uncharacterized protein n=1 Tax=Penicillium hispanicum TaxID=1080232 RepID=UPI0025402FCF|nr:uncharacterized protein N7459_004160 [Penicillium hispanicum]KAJ5584360.1 hypothetical protein N7459_004160 [Penicillium hispanicum]